MKKAEGNMYDWVTHTHNALGGQCPHRCSYCYVKAGPWASVRARYSGPLRLLEKELAAPLGKGHKIFICHLNDLFAAEVPAEMIRRVLEQCRAWPDNEYVFQTKNPGRFLEVMNLFPLQSTFGTTIESNRKMHMFSEAPSADWRFLGIRQARALGPTFITIEPILDFDLEPFFNYLRLARPSWINIGADSKGHGVPEPEPEKVRELISRLRLAGVEVRWKANLARLLGYEQTQTKSQV